MPPPNPDPNHDLQLRLRWQWLGHRSKDSAQEQWQLPLGRVRSGVSRMVMDSIGAEGCPKVRVRVRVMVRAIVSVRTRDRVR